MNVSPSATSIPNLRLTENEQSLLRAALSSNSNPTPLTPHLSTRPSAAEGPISQQESAAPDYSRSLATMGSYSANMYKSPDQETPTSGRLDGLESDTSPLLDFELEDGSFDWDNTGMIGDLPTTANGDDTEHHDKRKKSIDEDDGDEATGKRREGEEKGSARKPGRKPLTGEPTTVSLIILLNIRSQTTDLVFSRNAKLRIELHNAPSVSGKNVTSRTWS